MKVLYVTSEAYPFAASGGLADVSGALPKALRKRLIGCRVVLPLYESVPDELREKMHFLTSFSVPVAWRRQYCGVYEARMDGVIYYLLDNQYYFKREGLYGHYDDAERFAFFARAALEMLSYIDFRPEIVHCNDWQTALVPVYLRTFYSQNPLYSPIKTVFTIHNIQYQGKYTPAILGDVFGLSEEQGKLVDYNDCINLMKGGIECANAVTTVSETYAKEILDPWYSHGLDGILRERSWKLSGIINGIDTDVYNPETDPALFRTFSEETLVLKAANKKALQQLLGLPAKSNVPLISMVTRLTAHKGLDLVRVVLEDFLSGEDDLQFVVLGSGEAEYESFFKEMAEKYPDKIAFKSGFIPDLAHKIYGASDIFLMPSKSEPCGLAQMVALRYGTIPIVRETGGLKDTIKDSGDGFGNGFTFNGYEASQLAHAIQRAIAGYNESYGWQLLVKRAMAADNSWAKSAGAYIKLYKSLLKD